MVDDSPDRVSSFFEREIPSLPESFEVRLLKLPEASKKQGMISLLQNTLASLIPEIGPEFATIAPSKWGDAIKSERAGGTTNGRWIMVDRFHEILNASTLERKIFSEVLQQLAEIPSFGVIVGITTDSAVQMAALLNLIETKGEKVTTPIPGNADDTTLVPAILDEETAASYFFVTSTFREDAAEVVVYGVTSESSVQPGEGATIAEVSRVQPNPLNPAKVQMIKPAGHTSVSPMIPLLKPILSIESLDLAHISGEPKFVPAEDSPRHEVLYFVAEANCFGHGVEKNLEKGIAMLKQSDEMGSEKAANLLGTCYSRGFGVDQDYKQAKLLFEKAIERGSSHAYGNLGVLFLRGLGCEKNTVEAREQFVRGAKAGDPVAAYFAAKCFEEGIGNEDGTKNPELAVFWYLESEKGGHADALAWCRQRKLMPEAPKSITF